MNSPPRGFPMFLLLTCFTACTETVKGFTYSLEAKLYPCTFFFKKGMLTDSSFSWILKSPEDESKLRMQVTEMKSGGTGSWCYNDSLWIFDGDSVRSDLLAVVCAAGSTIYRSSGRHLFISHYGGPVWKTDIALNFTFWRTNGESHSNSVTDQRMKIFMYFVVPFLISVGCYILLRYSGVHLRRHLFKVSSRPSSTPDTQQPCPSRVISHGLADDKNADLPPSYDRGTELPPSYSLIFGDVTSGYASWPGPESLTASVHMDVETSARVNMERLTVDQGNGEAGEREVELPGAIGTFPADAEGTASRVRVGAAAAAESTAQKTVAGEPPKVSII